MSADKKKIVVFDFDGTLYSGDSLIDLCLFYYQKKPLRIWYVIIQALSFIRWKTHRITTTQFKSIFVGFLRADSETEILRIAHLFWLKNRKFKLQILNEFYQWKKEDVVLTIVSASPDLFLQPIAAKLGADVIIATALIPSKNRHLILENCRGEIKIKRLTNYFGAYQLLAAYSDNEDDIPLLKMAHAGYFVKDEKYVAI
jgi:phosphatidylglycerophosphatase C